MTQAKLDENIQRLEIIEPIRTFILLYLCKFVTGPSRSRLMVLRQTSGAKHKNCNSFKELHVVNLFRMQEVYVNL